MPPQIINGRVMVPMRKIFESLGAIIEWDSYTQTVTAESQVAVVSMQINNAAVWANNKSFLLDVPPQIVSNRTMVPVRAVAECLQCEVKWDENTKTVYINQDRIMLRSTPKTSDYIDVWFNNTWISGVNTSISGITVIFNGSFTDIDPDAFTDMILKHDGIPVNSKLAYKGRQTDSNGYVGSTGFIFEFERENSRAGVYSFSGKYKGMPFYSNFSQLVEHTVSAVPANPNDLWEIGFMSYYYHGTQEGGIDGFQIRFKGLQQTLYLSDLTDMKLYVNDREVAFAISHEFFRHAYVSDNEIITQYQLHFQKPLTHAGIYRLTGKYMGMPFKSSECGLREDGTSFDPLYP